MWWLRAVGWAVPEGAGSTRVLLARAPSQLANCPLIAPRGAVRRHNNYIKQRTMNHYVAAALLMVVAIGFPMLCAAMGMRVNGRIGGWWD